jgi:hypothetical protein
MVAMRRVFLLVIVALAVGLASMPLLPVRAAEAVEMSDEQVEQVKQNCKQAQSIMQRLQTTDVVTRTNRGRIYENMLNQLISHFNSRVSLNRYDAASLTTTTTAITQKFSSFKTDYQVYADLLSSVLSTNCESDPRGFYAELVATRSARETVANDVADLNTLFDRYEEAFNLLRTSIEGRP